VQLRATPRAIRARIRGAAWLLTLVVLAHPSWALEAAQPVAEPALKAAFLLNFTKFTDWPEDELAPAAPLVLCSADSEVAAALDGLVAGRAVNQHALTLRRVKLDESVRGCALLYTGRLDEKRTSQLVSTLGGASILTVGDAQDFAARGGMIGFFVDDGRMRFAINRGAVQRTRLKLRAQLLTLAKIIKEGL
jgi:hypothetical protein